MFDRLRMVWCILTGRPVMFRVTVEGGMISFDGSRGGHFSECHFRSILMTQHNGGLPRVEQMMCAAHALMVVEGPDGALVCPMDGEVIFQVGRKEQ